MSQVLFPEYIPLMTRASGTQAQLSSSAKVKIGGQMYSFTAPLTLTVGVLTANTIYYIYAVRSGGSTILVQSTNVNSVGPVGYTYWKLVGAFMTNNAGAIGAMIDLNTANSEPFENDAAYTMAAQFGTLSYYNVYQQKTGSFLKVSGSLLFGTVSVGADTYIQIPHTIDFVRFPDGGNQIMPRGTAEVRHASNNFIYGEASGSILALKLFTDSNTANNWLFAGYMVGGLVYKKAQSNVYTTGQGFGFQFEVPIVGWSQTPLKDL